MKVTFPVVVLMLFAWSGGQAASAQSAGRLSAEQVESGVYQFSGILWNQVAQGSATVVRHPRIAASAAHVVFDDFAFADGASWLGDNYFLAKHHSPQNPTSTGLAKPLRGFWNFASYSSARDFRDDLVVHYAYEDLAGGGCARWTASNNRVNHPLNSDQRKILVGYASTERFYMNRAGPFQTPFRRSDGQHFWNPNVGVVSGMSGGGAFVYSLWSGGGYVLGGVIVSGNPQSGQVGAGVRAFDVPASRLMANAIRSASVTTAVSVTATKPNGLVPIPDNSSLWTVIPLRVSGLPGSVEEVVISLMIEHPWIEDLEVALRSPSRRTRMLHDRKGFAVEDLTLDAVVASTSFRGTASNGDWELLVRDLAADDVGTIDSVELTITGR